MAMRILRLVGVAALVAFAACSDSLYGGGGGGPHGGRTVNIQVLDNYYSVSPDTVAVDDSVTWTWGGNSTHSVTFSSGASSATQSSGTFKRAFNPAGSYSYHCVVHGVAMSGVIVAQ
jgi:plastocyanin